MKNNSYVYIYTRLDNNTIFYVGKGKDNRYKDMYSRNEHFMNIVNKVDYKVEFLYTDLTNQQALDLEKETIHYLVFEENYGIDIEGHKKPNEIKHLCNQTWGGEGTSGYTWTEEHREKMSGRTLSDERKEKISKALKGRIFTEEHRENLSKANIGHIVLEETKKKISENHADFSGENHPKATKVIAIIENKPFATFDYIKQGAEYFGIKSSGDISNCCQKKKVKTCGKWQGHKLVWYYLKTIEL